MIITRIRIKNFRSISDSTISLNDVTVFVGDNDAGKSNILRALNLFFNNKTDSNTPFNFATDFNHNARVASNKAREISIELTISPPANYQGAKEVIWKRVWRREGLFADHEVRRFLDGEEFKPRSKITSWLSRIKFKYVPAIKGGEYFSELLGELHDCLSNTVDTQIKAAAKGFTRTINHHTASINQNLDARLGIKSSIQLPTDLKSLFVNLEFQATKTSLPLKQRGDGIKARHIPIILRFLADQDNFLRDRGSPQYTHIWGYEEPENNLELTKAFQLALEFTEYSAEVQILLTTHSPAFYQMHTADATIYHLSKLDQDSDSMVTRTEGDALLDIDEMMGAMPLIAPHVAERVAHYNILLTNAASLLADTQKKPTLFVEGPSDVAILSTAFRIFSPDSLGKIRISASQANGGGGGWVTDMLIAWIYSRETIPAAGLFDADQSGKDAKGKVVDNAKYAKQHTVKPFVVPKPANIVRIFEKKLNIGVAAEEVLGIHAWKHAEQQGWLEHRPDLARQNPSLISNHSISIDEALCSKGLSADEMLIVKNRCSAENKKNFSVYASKLSGEKASEVFAGFKPLVAAISAHLLPLKLAD
jgi:predicted ATP-dependent endonuclease of OLD family